MSKATKQNQKASKAIKGAKAKLVQETPVGKKSKEAKPDIKALAKANRKALAQVTGETLGVPITDSFLPISSTVTERPEWKTKLDALAKDYADVPGMTDNVQRILRTAKIREWTKADAMTPEGGALDLETEAAELAQDGEQSLERVFAAVNEEQGEIPKLSKKDQKAAEKAKRKADAAAAVQTTQAGLFEVETGVDTEHDAPAATEPAPATHTPTYKTDNAVTTSASANITVARAPRKGKFDETFTGAQEQANRRGEDYEIVLPDLYKVANSGKRLETQYGTAPWNLNLASKQELVKDESGETKYQVTMVFSPQAGSEPEVTKEVKAPKAKKNKK